MNRGIKGSLAAKNLGFNAATTADYTSAAFDTKGLESAGFLVNVETFTFTGSNKIALKMTECDTEGGSYTDVAAKDYEGGVIKELTTAADGGKTHAVGYVGSKRFIKAFLDVSGTVDVDVAVTGISTNPLTAPAI